MIQTKRLKIWLLLTQAIIIVGMGHSLAPFGVIEGFSLTKLFDSFSLVENGDISDLSLRLVALMSFLGQIIIVASIFVKSKTQRPLQLLGLLALWFAVFIFEYVIRNDNYSHLLVITCIPFLFCTVYMLFGRRIIELWRRYPRI